MARWLFSWVLGLAVLLVVILNWICERYPNLCTRECVLSAFQNDSCLLPPVLPSVNAISPADPNPTSQNRVRYEVQFNQDVTGVDLTDFRLDPTIPDAAVDEVQGSGRVYTVFVNTGSENGSLQLNLVDDDSIRTSDGTPLGGEGTGNGNFSGQPYTVEKSAPPPPNPPPFANSINRLDGNPTAQPRVNYEVQFDQEVTGVDLADFRLTTGGSVTGARVSYLQGSGGTYQVLVTTGTGNGTIQLNLVDDDSIKNSEGTPLGGAGAGNGNLLGQIYTVQRETQPPSPPPKPIPGMW